jgi:GntR family transcriptional regulator
VAEAFVYSVNIHSAVAVYVQIQNQVQFAIASGKLKPSDTLPSVRVMSSSVNVNQNTVTKAYRELELLGIVSSRRGYGITVTEKAPKITKAFCAKLSKEQLREAVGIGLASGLSPAEVRSLVAEYISLGATPYLSTENGR